MRITLNLDNTNKVFHIPSLTGYIDIFQENEFQPTIFTIDIQGLKPNHLHGIHIHEKGVQSKKDLESTCDSCGGHFNPTNKQHGSIFNKNTKNRHIGDLINNLKSDVDGNCYIVFKDNLASIYPTYDKPYTILGRSIVIHDDTDDLGRKGLDINTIPYLYQINEKVYIQNNNNNSLEKYKQYTNHDKHKSSILNGNAGKRILCATINQ
jgi:Cu-Zn family superoxide dismutase